MTINKGSKASNLTRVHSDVKVLELADPKPFATPSYRTKRNCTDLVQILANSAASIKYKLVEERHVYGGELLVVNAQPGDWVTAAITDEDGIIPEPYRAALCENWPIVATYVEKAWVHATNPTGMIVQKINTYPLNAKITPGLYLELTYNANDVGTQRDVYVNYYLSKKL